MDPSRMPTLSIGDSEELRMKILELEDINLDLFLDAYRDNNLEFLQGGFRDGDKHCPASAVTRAAGDSYDVVNWPSYPYLVGLAHGTDGLPCDPSKYSSMVEYNDDHYRKGYGMGVQVREAVEAGALEKVPDYPPEVPVDKEEVLA